MNFWLWSVGHIIVALSPLAIVSVALHISSKNVTAASVLGDGFLFFFGVVLAADLFSDVLKALVEQRMNSAQAAAVVSGAFLYVLAAWIGYFIALQGRLDGKGDGGGFVWPSVLLSGFGLTLTLWVRYYFNLW